jgi:hypothetical protein
MAHYAKDVANKRGLGIPSSARAQMIGDAALAQQVAGTYARRQGIPIEAHLTAKYGKPLSLRRYGEYVVTLLTDPRYETGVAYGVKAGTGITPLDA